MQLVGNKYFPIRNELIQSVKPLTETADGDAALVLTALMSIITILPYSMEQLVDVENCMTSVERIVEYGALKPEAYLDNTDGQMVHELGGKLELEHVWLRYAEDEKYVLKDISFTIDSKEKAILISILSKKRFVISNWFIVSQIGVAGRTGAGKSSLITALFRLAEPEGSILLNGINILQLPLHKVRRHLSIIPQDPTMFACTLRENLDPFGEYSDEVIWSALEKVRSS